VIICQCRSVSDRTIRRAVHKGARTREDVVQACAASLSCGGCAPAIDAIIETEIAGRDETDLTTFSALAVVS